ncbi:hypothetical protein R1T16_05570 [Flavobacterium sp. DG1-102-2]|uniref:hypothetical protein n=1 Tax=Flavobacterium sp. DG1-102-2 TaxID=3081663 RepID=UPI00294A9802|nr:hypothetical protein [Flavobacterium sp. DG1-102-2]MDV6167884.1 hypothetical protein [Flavobacterium sp. DG1-102-2]
MKSILLVSLILSSAFGNAQVIVNEVDLNTNVEAFEVYLMAKMFNTKESIFANTGSNDFKIQNYDTKRQAIFNAEGKKFEKGEYLNLYTYLMSQGWEEGTKRNVNYGDSTGTCIMFKRKKA